MAGDDDRRRRAVLAGGALALAEFAGCLRLEDGRTTGTTDGDDAPSTPAEATAATTEPSTSDAAEDAETDAGDASVEYPPGVTDDDVSETLVRAHEEVLSGTSRTVETSNMGYVTRTTRFDGSGRAFVSNSFGLETFVADGELYQRYAVDGETIYAHHPSLRFDFEQHVIDGTSVLRALVRAGDFAPAGRVTRDGETSFLLEADGFLDQRPIRQNRLLTRYFRQSEFPLSSLSGEAVASADGVVSKLDVTLRSSNTGGPFVVKTRDVGATSVSTPTWTSTARAEEPTFELSRTADGAFLRVAHVGGQTVGSSTDVRFGFSAHDGPEFFNGSFTGSSTVGSTFYLYKTDERTEYGSPKLGVRKDAKPSSSSTAGEWSTSSGMSLRVDELVLVEDRRLS